MKINFGIYKNKNIIVGKNFQMRPTTSMAKSKIFNSIKITEEMEILDLFAGTGSLGFESLSLGAKKVIFVEKNYPCYMAIKKTISNLEIENIANAYNTDFRIALKNIKSKVSIIFLDPPFIAINYYDLALDIILKRKILSQGGIVVLEKERKTIIKTIDNWDVVSIIKIGEKDIYILKEKNE